MSTLQGSDPRSLRNDPRATAGQSSAEPTVDRKGRTARDWVSPLPLDLVPTDCDNRSAPATGTTWLPLAPHPGAFGVKRAHHTHEGVDLYAAEGTPVRPVETGRVVVVEPFTGAIAGSPWWHDTWAVFVEGRSGVVVYGEIQPDPSIRVGMTVETDRVLGHVIPVLRVNKGRPMTMLHLELHEMGARAAPAWEGMRPRTLLDPTSHLLGAAAPTGPDSDSHMDAAVRTSGDADGTPGPDNSTTMKSSPGPRARP